ncbi:MAG TPA: hypothetical protein VKH42_18465 [Vicinamibacterales bacterium]|nr:hypothetical protein [Vicinamibacterales bacterium]
MPSSDVVILGAARTPIGGYGGSLRVELNEAFAPQVPACLKGLATLCVSGGMSLALAIETCA